MKKKEYWWHGAGAFPGMHVGPFSSETDAREAGPSPIPEHLATLVKRVEKKLIT